MICARRAYHARRRLQHTKTGNIGGKVTLTGTIASNCQVVNVMITQSWQAHWQFELSRLKAPAHETTNVQEHSQR